MTAEADRQRRAELARLSMELEAAERDGHRIALLTERLPDLTEAEAYAIARTNFERRGRPCVGYKLGYTSRAMREQMGIAQPNFGRLSEDRLIGPAATGLDAPRLVHPRVEPELTLELGSALRGPGCTDAAAAAAIAWVYPSLEVVDTRYADYRFTARDNIADNSSSAYCVLGAAVAFHPALDLKNCTVTLRAPDQSVLAEGCGADALGDPVHALAWLADALAGHGEALHRGDRVMTGGLTRAYPIGRGERLSAIFTGLGRVEVQHL